MLLFACVCAHTCFSIRKKLPFLCHQEEAEEEEEEASEEEVEEEPEKRKGPVGIIEIQNPNLVKPKNMKAKDVDLDKTTELSRREREEIEKQKAHERYMRLQEQGKTEQARKNLERLSLIRKQRAEAARKREEEKAGIIHSINLSNMGARNMLCSSQMIDFQMDQQGQSHLHPDPCLIMGSMTSFPHPNIHSILPPPGNTTNLNVQHLPEHYDSGIFYGMTPYNGVQNHHPATNLDLGVAAVSNYYNPYIAPSSGARVFPISLNHGSSEQLPSSSNHGVIGVPTDEYGRSNYFMNDARGSCKRKNAEGIAGNFQHFNAPASSGSAFAPLNTRHLEPGVAVMDAESFSLIQYGGNGIPQIMEGGSHRSVRNRSGAIGVQSVLAYNHNHLVQGNYMGQPFQPTSSPWLDQPLSSNSGSMEAGNMAVQGYHETARNRSSTSFPRPPPVNHRNHNLHHPPPPPMQGVRSQNINFHPQVAASSYRLPTNSTSRRTVNLSQDGVETGPRHLGPVPPTGFRIYRPHHAGTAPEATSRHNHLPYLRYLQADEVAMLELPDYYEVGNSIDHHRDMRLDIDLMSYEELLALGERIGNVNTGLSEETIRSHLKTRTYVTCINLEEAACVDRETDSCIICQSDFENQEKIGTLDCGHEYHADCLKKWLLVKNVCPICKSSALTTERRDG
ncbi:hypothetical protein L1049_000896 [Liquidambar formosana]|uniref:RING-type E3 ubiquitin transferase n=1 Tax=Liquidambar formosana TaxID=63359 RepID=A0AAP0R3J8_LIQFO